jgi:hypothetical protein
MLKNHIFFPQAFTRKGLFQLFMVCVFPIHAWALLMGFRDFSWVAQRTDIWDAFGLLSYSMVFALVETTGIFFIILMCGFLMPNRIDREKRLALLGTAFLLVAFWAILGQVYSWMRTPLPGWLLLLLQQTNHPFRYLWGAVFLLVGTSAVLPLLLISKRENFKRTMIEIFDRISTVSALYIFFDILGIIIIVIRNSRV